MISNRYATASNPYLQDYDPHLPRHYLMYLDANNLYGWTVGQSLPTNGFEWLNPEKVEMNVKMKSIFRGSEVYN